MKKISCLLLFMGLSVFSSLASNDLYAQNRQKLMQSINDGIILIPSTKDFSSWGSDKNFLYLTGFNIPGAIIAINPNGEKKEVLFISENAKEDIPKDCSIEVQPLSNINGFLRKCTKLYIPINRIQEFNELLGNANIFRGINNITNINPIIFNMRLLKSMEEVELIEKAINLTGIALNEAFKQSKTGNREVDLYAQIEYQALKNGVKTSFYQVASGPNSTNVHFDCTERPIKSKETIVFDIGIYYRNYTSDISRTFPVDGKFTKEQKQIYNIVLKAQKVGISKMVTNATHDYVEKKVKDELSKGLYELGLMTDSTSDWQREFYIQHGFSHGIGLDVHDIYYYFKSLPERKYAVGMVYTMEPGLYFPEDMIKSIPERLNGKVTEEEFKQFVLKVGDTYKKYINIGVRIEDDILITETGNRNLSVAIPKEIEDIEKIIR